MIMATIAENLTLLESTKANIKQAIVNKGVSVSDTDTFASYADKIGQISGGSSAAALDFGSINYAYAPTYLKNGLDASVAYLNRWTGNHFPSDSELMFMPKVEIIDSEPVNLDYVGRSFPKLLIFPDIDFKHKDINGAGLFESSKAISIHLKNIHFVGSLNSLFSNCTNLVDFTYSGLTIDSNVTEAINCFYGCSLTAVPDLFNGAQTGLTDLSWMFQGCDGMTTIDLSSWKFGQVTNISNMFTNCINAITIDITGIDTSKMTSASDMGDIFNFCYNLVRVRGAIDLIGMNLTGLPSLGYSVSSLTTITYKNLGRNPEITSLDLYPDDNYAKWGLGDEESKQSFIDSVLTYSYDRAANGLPTLELTMKQEQKALLTEEQITAIQAKGYTISA